MELFKQTLRSSEILRIGKNLITETIVESIKNLLKSKTFIKIKILKNALTITTKEKIIKEIILKTNAFLFDIRGNSFIISNKSFPEIKINKKCREIMREIKNISK